MNRKFLFFVVVVSLFGLVGYTMVNEQIPVLTYSEAKLHRGKFQLKGVPIKEKTNYDQEKKVFKFSLVDDKKQEFEVWYNGVKPGNYDQANEVVVIGSYSKDGYVKADRLLVKCPSKYEAEGSEGYVMKEY